MATVIREARETDLPVILEIFNRAIETSIASFDSVPKTIDDRIDWFRAHSDKYPFIVAELDNVVVGYAEISKWSERPCYQYSVEWSIYVDETKRGKGVGAALTQSMIDRCSKLNYHVLIGRISEGNEASVRIHAKFGFEVCGVMKELGYKWGQWRNVVIMQKILNASPAPSQ